MRIINATIYTMTQGIIENGFLETLNDKISAIGTMTELKDEKYDGKTIDAKNALVFPGFIDSHTHLGMCEDSIGGAGDDLNESSDPSTPQMRAIDAINPYDRNFEEAIEGGITSVITGPGSANPISGQMVAIKTAGRCIDDMVIKTPVAIKFALGENPKSVYGSKKSAPITRMATAAIIREQLIKAKSYAEKSSKERQEKYNAKFEALLPLFQDGLPMHIHAHRSDDIATAIRIAEEFGLNYTIVHATQGYEISDLLAKKNVSVLCGPIICDRSKPELMSLTPSAAGVLSTAGVKFSIVTDHPVIPVQYLNICAGLAVREGLDHYEALKAITILPAEICGISDRVGSLEVGKDADIAIFDQDPLTLAAKPVMVIINGDIKFERN